LNTFSILILPHSQRDIDLIERSLSGSPILRQYIRVPTCTVDLTNVHSIQLPHTPWTSDEYEVIWQLPLMTSTDNTLFIDSRQIAVGIDTLSEMHNQRDQIVFGELLTTEEKYVTNHLPPVNSKQILFRASDACNQFFDLLKVVGRNWADISKQVLPPNFRNRESDLICSVIVAAEPNIVCTSHHIINFYDSDRTNINQNLFLSSNSPLQHTTIVPKCSH
jgi:hypothetical protein